MQEEKLFPILFSIVAFTMPFGFFYNINSISILVLLFLTILYAFKKKQKIKIDNTLLILPFVYFLLLLISVFYSENILKSFKYFDKYLSFLVFPLIFILLNKCAIKKIIRYAEISFVLGNVVGLLICYTYGVLVFYQDSLPLLKGSFYFTKVIDMHPSYFSMFLVICVAISIKRFDEIKVSNKLIRCLIQISLYGLLVFSIWFLSSRAGIISLILFSLFIVYQFISKRVNGNSLLMIVSLTVVFVFSYFTIKSEYSFLDRDIETSVETRVEIWNAAANLIEGSAIFGYGVGDVRKVLDRQFYLNGFDLGIDKSYNAHNQYLESFVTGGIFLCIVLLFILIVLILRYKETNNPAVLGFVIAIIVGMSFESILVRQHGIIFFNFFYGIYCVNYKRT